MTTSTPTDTAKYLTLVYCITSPAQQTRLLAEGRWVASAHSNALAERDALRNEVAQLEPLLQEAAAIARENRSRVVELEVENARLQQMLDAVGAGGVEPLRRAKCLHQIAEPKQKPVAFGSAEEFSSSDDPHCKNGGKACIDCLMRGECLHQTVEPVPEAAQEPMFWVRLTDSGGYEGPLHRSSIEDAHKKSGAWTPLYTAPQPPAPVRQPPAVEPVPKHQVINILKTGAIVPGSFVCEGLGYRDDGHGSVIDSSGQPVAYIDYSTATLTWLPRDLPEL